MYFTAVGEAELRHALALLPAGKRRRALTAAVEGILEEAFHGRVLPFDREAARAYATIAVERRAAGRPIAQLDCQIAAIARARRRRRDAQTEGVRGVRRRGDRPVGWRGARVALRRPGPRENEAAIERSERPSREGREGPLGP